MKNSQSPAKYIKIFIYIRFLKSKIYGPQTALLKEIYTNIYKNIIILYILVEYILRIRRVLGGKNFYIFIYLAFFEDMKSISARYSWLFMAFIIYKNGFKMACVVLPKNIKFFYLDWVVTKKITQKIKTTFFKTSTIAIHNSLSYNLTMILFCTIIINSYCKLHVDQFKTVA